MTTSETKTIQIEHQPSETALTNLRVFQWPIWTKEVSKFPWTYDTQETCYILEGEVTVTPEGGSPVEIKKGDLVTFPEGMSCTWNITHPIKKHYNFG